jgi:lysophospholipase L1-like esterase
MLRVAGCLILVVLACTVACDDKNPTEPTSPPNPNEVHYTAVGASDAIGVGATVLCPPFLECPDGTGYVPVLARRLRATGKTVQLTNLGIPGAVLSPEVEALGTSLGRNPTGNILERALPFVPLNATLITVFAGGNDINTIGAAVQAGRGGSDPTTYVATQTNNFGRDIRTLFSGVRERAPSARVIVLNLPNFAGLPIHAGLTVPEKRVMQAIAVGFSAQVNALSTQGALVLDLMCDPRSYLPSNYSSDGFHPNDAGYAYLADLAFVPANTGSVTPPRASCPPMALF